MVALRDTDVGYIVFFFLLPAIDHDGNVFSSFVCSDELLSLLMCCACDC